MKKIALLLSLIMIASFIMIGCGNEGPSESLPEAETEGNWKIGIITGTVAQNEEEYRAAQAVLEKYGEERVVLQTYPDKFMDEQETLIANIAGVASNPDVKALVICQAVPGTSAAIDKIMEVRDDLLIIAAVCAEDPNMIAERADICLYTDKLGMGKTIIDQAVKQGAKTFVHYSFPRHMSQALQSTRRDLFKENCEKNNIKFVDATAPDPTGDAGVAGAQQFILEDVPKKVEEYGVDTAFFSTNCSMQTPLIKQCYELGAIYPQPCCPSPFHGFPGALEIEITEDKKGDINYMISKIREKTKEKGIEGRMSTWPVPVSMMFIEAGAEYAIKWINGDIEEKMDIPALKHEFDEYVLSKTHGERIKVNTEPLKEGDKTIENFLMILVDFITF